MRNPYHKLQRDWYFWVIYGVFFITALISVKFLVYFFIVPGMLAMHAGGLINVVCHKWGYRNFDTNDFSRNNIWVNAYSYFGGVGLHNNHHQNPGRWDNRVKPGEIDFSAWIIEKFLMIKEEKHAD
jgi:stearoyl-CoA desaturase (delta-9 desaturase)